MCPVHDALADPSAKGTKHEADLGEDSLLFKSCALRIPERSCGGRTSSQDSVIHVAVTRAPTQQWTAQQLRNATPFGQGPLAIIRDRDDKFGADFDRVAKGAGIRVLRTAVRAPLMNSVCERFLGSVRRECLDHLIILSERQRQHVLVDYAMNYFNTARPHQGISQGIPVPAERVQAHVAGSVTAIPVLGGLHHDYRSAA